MLIKKKDDIMLVVSVTRKNLKSTSVKFGTTKFLRIACNRKFMSSADKKDIEVYVIRI